MSLGSVSSPKRTGCVEVSNALAIFGKFLLVALRQRVSKSLLYRQFFEIQPVNWAIMELFLPWPSCPKPYTFNHLARRFCSPGTSVWPASKEYRQYRQYRRVLFYLRVLPFSFWWQNASCISASWPGKSFKSPPKLVAMGGKSGSIQPCGAGTSSGSA